MKQVFKLIFPLWMRWISEEGIFKEGENYEYWFKLIPWEDIAIEEGELAMLLTQIMRNQRAIILNPAYTLLFQSKGILKFYGNFIQIIHYF